MKQITFYFDVISPYAYLAFEKLPEALLGISHEVIYKPVLFAGMLKHFGQLGPAEIAPKREWTYRQVAWLAKEHQLKLDMPLGHPFNPIELLRLGIACGQDGACNRFVAENLFHHVWHGGMSATDPKRIEELKVKLHPQRLTKDEAVKQELIANTHAAASRGIFGVPSMQVEASVQGLNGQIFWGFDALPMLRSCLLDDTWFGEEWQNLANIPIETARKPFVI